MYVCVAFFHFAYSIITTKYYYCVQSSHPMKKKMQTRLLIPLFYFILLLLLLLFGRCHCHRTSVSLLHLRCLNVKTCVVISSSLLCLHGGGREGTGQDQNLPMEEASSTPFDSRGRAEGVHHERPQWREGETKKTVTEGLKIRRPQSMWGSSLQRDSCG